MNSPHEDVVEPKYKSKRPIFSGLYALVGVFALIAAASSWVDVGFFVSKYSLGIILLIGAAMSLVPALWEAGSAIVAVCGAGMFVQYVAAMHEGQLDGGLWLTLIGTVVAVGLGFAGANNFSLDMP